MSYLFFFSHAQQWAPLLAPASLMLVAIYFSAKGGFHRDISSRQLLLIFTILYLTLNLLLNVRIQPDIDYIIRLVATDARLLYLLAFSLILSAVRIQYADFERMMNAAIVMTTIICAVSLLSFVTTPFSFQDFDFGAIRVPAGHWPVGFLETKNPFAGSLGSIFVLALSWMFVRGGFDILKTGALFSVAACCLIFLCLLLAGSTGYLFGTLAALAYMIVFEANSQKSFRFRNYMKYAVLIVSVIVFSAFIVIYHDRLGEIIAGQDLNMQRRIAVFHRSLALIAQSPLFGLGPGAVEAYQINTHVVVPGLIAVRENAVFLDDLYWVGILPVGQHAHNIFLQILSDYGLVGLVLLGSFFFKALYANRFSAMRAEGVSAIRFIARVQLVYLVTSGLVAGYSISSPSTAWAFYVALGWLSQPRLFNASDASLERSS